MFPQWQVLHKRIDLHIMANKTLWKQMSGKLFTLIQILQGEGFQNAFLKHGLTLMDERLGWTAGTFAALVSHLCRWKCIGIASPALGMPRESPGRAGHTGVLCAAAGTHGAEPRAGRCSRLGHSPHLVCLTLCILLVLGERTAQTLPSAKHTWNI